MAAEHQVELGGEGRDLSSQARSAVLNINTVFKLQRKALFPLVYFNFNFCVRNSTWNADTAEHGAREKRTWHMIRVSPAGILRLLRQTPLFPPNSAERCESSLECNTPTRHYTSAQTHLRQRHTADPTPAERIGKNFTHTERRSLLLRDQATFSSLF